MKDGENMQAVETDFVTGNMNLKELSEAHNLDYEYLRQVACKKGWTKKREQYRSQVSHKEVTKIADHTANTLANRRIMMEDIKSTLLKRVKDKLLQDDLTSNDLNLLANAITKVDTMDNDGAIKAGENDKQALAEVVDALKGVICQDN